VRAAGGVVWRRRRDGVAEVLVVHRPKYDDWSLPKGKLEGAESDEECALREVEEETGLRCRLGPELPTVRYRDHKDRPKVVRYWAMEPESGEFVPHHEIDDVRWVAIEEAGRLLSYDFDRSVVEALQEV
jgi:8-oxo-dGTP diphosphatase